MIKNMMVGYAGLDHLGLNSAIAAASKGATVIGYDESSYKISQLKKGNFFFKEPGLVKLYNKNKKKIYFSSEIKKLSKCKIVYISLDVETDTLGKSNLNPIKKLITNVIKILNNKTILVILSQVSPGFTRKVNWNKEKLFYQVETLIFGKALSRALYPERLIIGCSNSSNLIHFNLKNFLKKYNCPILPMKYESAEFTKISINIFLASSVTTTNTLSELCEKIGGDWSEIIPALQMDKRIGKHAYLKPGLGISGGNLERDINNVFNFSKKNKTDNKIIKSIILNSKYRKKWVFNKLTEEVLKNKTNPKICILGLTYKENTSSLKNSPSINLIKKIKKYQISVYDPAIKNKKINYPVHHAKNIFEAISNADVLLILTPWKIFNSIEPKSIKRIMKGKVIIDPYRVLNDKKLNNYGFSYFTLGKKNL